MSLENDKKNLNIRIESFIRLINSFIDEKRFSEVNVKRLKEFFKTLGVSNNNKKIKKTLKSYCEKAKIEIGDFKQNKNIIN